MTLNDLQWLFHVKFCFRPALLTSDNATFENNCVKTNKDRPYCQRRKSPASLAGTLVSGDVRFIYAYLRGGSAERRRQRTVVLRLNARLELLSLVSKTIA